MFHGVHRPRPSPGPVRLDRNDLIRSEPHFLVQSQPPRTRPSFGRAAGGGTKLYVPISLTGWTQSIPSEIAVLRCAAKRKQFAPLPTGECHSHIIKLTDTSALCRASAAIPRIDGFHQKSAPKKSPKQFHSSVTFINSSGLPDLGRSRFLVPDGISFLFITQPQRLSIITVTSCLYYCISCLASRFASHSSHRSQYNLRTWYYFSG